MQHVRGWQWCGEGTVSAGKGLRLLPTALLEELCAQPRPREFQAARLVPRRSSLGSLGEHLNKALVPTLTLLGSCGTFKGWGLVGASGVMGSVLSEGIAGLSAFLFPTIRGVTATALPNHRPELQNSEPGKAVPPVHHLGSPTWFRKLTSSAVTSRILLGTE